MSKTKPNQSLIMAVETSGRAGSVALATGSDILGEREFSGPMRHGAELFPAMAELLQASGSQARQIGEVYISVGPGSFTGLRIAVTFAKTMHLANKARIVAVPTLDVIASNVIDFTGPNPPAKERQRLGVVLDAKRGQFFVAVYEYDRDSAKFHKTLPESLMTADEFVGRFANSHEPIRLLGEGLVYYRDKFTAPGVELFDEEYWWPKASKVFELGRIKVLSSEFADPLSL
ncbi:unnamed protein product, partial [marine sediment metagenome]